MSKPPIWQQAVVAVQQRANPLLRAAVDRGDVAAGIAMVQTVRQGVVRVTEAPTRRFLHAWNLPAASDMNRLLVEIAGLEREVRTLRKRLDDTSPAPKEPYR